MSCGVHRQGRINSASSWGHRGSSQKWWTGDYQVMMGRQGNVFLIRWEKKEWAVGNNHQPVIVKELMGILSWRICTWWRVAGSWPVRLVMSGGVGPGCGGIWKYITEKSWMGQHTELHVWVEQSITWWLRDHLVWLDSRQADVAGPGQKWRGLLWGLGGG